jgi:hypothetical protein
MEDKFEDLLSFYGEIDFGKVTMTDGEKLFCLELSNEIVALCRSLPQSAQTDAFLFLMRYLATPFGQPLNFFKNYYAPSWSIVYWLIHAVSAKKPLKQEEKQSVKTAHSMALFLHPFDDHLSDKQLPITHLNLLLRSQAWMLMHQALNCLTNEIEEKEEIVQRYIDDYYSSIACPKEFLSLDDYCEFFRKQMATWLIVPVLIVKKMGIEEGLSDAVQAAYGSFGIAWRLLDDIQDIKIDMIKNRRSAIYTVLSEDIRHLWDKNNGNKDGHSMRLILEYLYENNAIEKIRSRICRELDSAASLAAAHKKITYWADELRCLMRPLKNQQSHP